MRSKILALVSAFAAFLAVMVGLFGSPATASASPAVTDSVTINQMVTLSNSVEESKFSVSASDSSYFTASCVFSWTGPVSGHSQTIVIDSMAGGSTISGNLPDGNYTGTVTCTASNVSGSFLATAPFTIGTATPSATPTPTVITEPAPTVTLDSQGNLKVTGKAPGVEGYKTVVYLLLNGEADAYTYAINPGSSYTLVDLLVVGRPTQVQVVAKVADVSYTGPGASQIVYDKVLTAQAPTPSTTPSAPSWTTGTWNHKNGEGNVPCATGGLFVLTGHGITEAQVAVNSGAWDTATHEGDGSWHYTYSGSITASTVVKYRYEGSAANVVFTLSHCTDTTTPSSSVTPTETPTGAPSVSTGPAPSAKPSKPVTSVTTPSEHSATTPAVVHTTTSTVEQSAAPLPHTGDAGTPQGSSLSLADDAGLALIALAVFIGGGVVLRKRYASHV